jgi:curved DNA-binding protein CbpA
VAEIARGSVADRPWGRTLGTLGLRGFTGQLTLTSDIKRYQIVFSDGAVVVATSPLASDAAVRVALTGGLISSTQVAEIARRQAAAPERDEIELLSELLRLGPEQTMRLRRRTIAQRAARTFSVDRGEFVIDDQIALPVVAGSEIDVRSVIYLGARQNLSEARLAGELATIGAWFRLQPSAIEDLPQFGFTEADRPVLERLQIGATLDELEADGVEARIARAMVYALASCNACEIGGAGRAFEAAARSLARPVRPAGEASGPVRAAGTVPPGGKAGLGRPPGGAGTGAPRRPTPPPIAGSGLRAQMTPALGTASLRSGPAIPPSGTTPRVRPGPPPEPSSGGPRSPRPDTRRPPARAADPARTGEVRALIAQRLLLLDQGVDHFELLGVAVDARPEDIRKAYFALARQLHPDRLAALGIEEGKRDAQRLFAQVNTAFSILSDKVRRAEYASVLRRGGEAAVAADHARAESITKRILDSEEAFQRGEAALRRDQVALAISELARAVELNPSEADYRAALAWAQFCAAPDKQVVGGETRAALGQAIAASPNAISARFLLGRVERILGNDRDALRHFQDVLRRAPNHHEAASEVRLIEQRLAGPARRR